MPHGRLGVPLVAAWLSCVAATPLLALSGTVVDSKGNAIEKAQVCFWHGNVEQLCVETNEHGDFNLFDSRIQNIRVTAPDYLPRVVPTSSSLTPIRLERAPVLQVKLVDARTGEPIPEGKVMVTYATGRQKGPFPANAAGVRIHRVLKPGSVRLLVSAEGYADAQPAPVTLEVGQESEIVVELVPEKKGKSSDGDR